MKKTTKGITKRGTSKKVRKPVSAKKSMLAKGGKAKRIGKPIRKGGRKSIEGAA